MNINQIFPGDEMKVAFAFVLGTLVVAIVWYADYRADKEARKDIAYAAAYAQGFRVAGVGAFKCERVHQNKNDTRESRTAHPGTRKESGQRHRYYAHERAHDEGNDLWSDRGWLASYRELVGEQVDGDVR